MWPNQNQGPERPSLPITSQALEERINMYISAMDKASALNNPQQSSQLQRDIQLLVDLMERLNSGQLIPESAVPPPLDITPQNDILANPLGELSSRMAEYHKALYFAEVELSDQRIHKIKSLQQGLQRMHSLQKRAQDGFPIRADEIPPQVPLPKDDVFDNNAVATITSRIAQYREIMASADTDKNFDKRQVRKAQSCLRTLEFLLTRAKANQPIWKKDIPPEFDYYCKAPKVVEEEKSKMMLRIQSIETRVSKIDVQNSQMKKEMEDAKETLRGVKELLSTGSESNVKQAKMTIDTVAARVKALEHFAEENQTKSDARKVESQMQILQENLALVQTRMDEYKAAALSAKHDDNVQNAIKNFKILKGLHPLKEALERGEEVDMTLVPPPPPAYTPTRERQPQKPLEAASGARADVSPINFRPSADTAEDILAKKLTTYLDEGNLIHPPAYTNAQSPQGLVTPLPKVQNSSAQDSAAVLSSLSHEKTSKSLLGSIDTLACNKGTGGSGRESGHLSATPVPGDSSLDASETCKVNSHVQGVLPEAEGAHGTSSPPPVTLRPTQNSRNGLDKEARNDNVNGHDTAAGQGEVKLEKSNGPARDNSEIYSRKTLDSVGFLSCQNVPDAVQQLSGSVEEYPSGEHTKANLTCESEVPTQKTHSVEGNTYVEESPKTLSSQFPVAKNQVNVQHNSILQEPAVSNDGSLKPSDQSNSIVQNSHDADSRNHEQLFNLPTTNSETFQSVSMEGHSSLPTVESKNCSDSLEKNSFSLPGHLSHDFAESGEEVLATSLSSLPDMTSNVTSSTGSNPCQDDLAFTAEQEGAAALPVVREGESCSSLSSKMEPHASTGIVNSDKEVGRTDELVLEKQGDSAKSDVEEFQDLMDSMSGLGGMPDFNCNTSLSNGASSLHDREPPNGCEVSASVPSVPRGDNDDDAKALKNPGLSASDSQFDAPGSMKLMTTDISYGSHSTQQPFLDDQSVSGQRTIPLKAATTEVEPFLPSHSSHMHPNSVSLSRSPHEVTPQQKQQMVPAQNLPNDEFAFTCLETLKYEWLLALGADRIKEAEKLKSQMDKVKNKLKTGGRSAWEVYKACVEKEFDDLGLLLDQMRPSQQWRDVKLLSEKRILAERELAILSIRLPELQW